MLGLFGTARPKKCPAELRVLFPRGVAERFTQEIRDHPKVEVGGKYVGFLHGAPRNRGLEERQEAMCRLTLEVRDYIEDGPLAQRTPSYHRGDAEFQTEAFRELEKRHPSIEHLGSWHSHHPNGLRELSEGDVQGYRDTVNAEDHHHDFFFASLGTDRQGFGTARHFLFVRGDKAYYELGAANLVLVPDPPRKPAGQRAQQAQQAQQQADEPGPAESRRPEGPTGAASVAVPGWTDSRSGQERLARDRAVLKKYPRLRYGVRSERLIVDGELLWDGRLPLHLRLLYPSSPHAVDGMLRITVEGRRSMEITIAGDQPGGLAFALEAADSAARCAAELLDRARRAADRESGGTR